MTIPFETELTTVASWVGLSHEEIRCWDLVQRAFRLRGVEIPDDYYSSLPLFRTVFEPEPWDVLAIKNHPLVTNHAGLYLRDRYFIHSMEGSGVTINRIDDPRWVDRIAKLTGRTGFLRLIQ